MAMHHQQPAPVRCDLPNGSVFVFPSNRTSMRKPARRWWWGLGSGDGRTPTSWHPWPARDLGEIQMASVQEQLLKHSEWSGTAQHRPPAGDLQLITVSLQRTDAGADDLTDWLQLNILIRAVARFEVLQVWQQWRRTTYVLPIWTRSHHH